MISLEGVPSALVARNQSWVRQQAQSLVRHLPANVEKADLIQVGLIAVAQASLSFVWDGDPDTAEAHEAFARYARQRVKGAMIDELRQMDVLTRAQRRKIKVLQIARERWRSTNGGEAGLAELARLCKMDLEEVALLEQLAQASQQRSSSGEDDEPEFTERHHPATEKDEVEARVDTAIVLRHLETFFAQLPERERRVIDAYLGIGMSPVELAASLKVTPSRVSQMYHGLLRRMAQRFGTAPQQRATDRTRRPDRADMEALVAQRERELQARPEAGPWGAMMEDVLVSPAERFGVHIDVPEGTRW
ncbi:MULTISPECIES: sigma-70 family RNA polymerase sigma factor [Rubrivivax]|uniref:Sigma-70 family RNA polymerase sigma factor n=1 Tax=Rubrivivax benzoatilyticus TaxID=316997 RepID=A0ABX0HWE1_9BURK|nr:MULTISPECIES: sigma-70 family RNA polymerase sigma factor [Rubrivivax]MCD0423018.1 sigma-70 family RNA polymerase sigma factor [Rubrivivax sp. JA1024]EGJ08815.1 FliA/WhiG family RNA polymerase sigma 28 subunit [Rubrivivax benzoatilyticus JA2 = ATCC BAA-35]MCC9596631.1 sigma-70 family RNA polymerase sigma factor [Rubrivivax sp. JA1055]NHK98626.1 sigma-70 family RNA polymerase sigma factor [Rubrivivax benzoatilyticus]NHL24128.1 sigma-70 family RNA polymerase sigma factor [Rubrivivax benzoatil